MKTSDFFYELPEELIAQDPLEERSSSRLMVLHRKSGVIEHKVFTDIIDYLKPGDCLVRNNTKVIPARLFGVKEDTGAAVELLLLKRKQNDIWETLVKPGKKARAGAKLRFGEGLLHGEIIEVLEDGNRLIQFRYEGIFEEILDELGQMPLPPYITHTLQDKNRYQTVYAKYEGSAAAPTAGLHFTEELFEKLKKKGVLVANVTLHVGLGTFRPVEADKINAAKAAGGRIVCVGTTSCRTLESAVDSEGKLQAGEGDTEIFIYPGYSFQMMDVLITNFHLPESTLLMLVSALAGKEQVMAAYKEAVRERYRFFSFGDAMLVLDD